MIRDSWMCVQRWNIKWFLFHLLWHTHVLDRWPALKMLPAHNNQKRSVFSLCRPEIKYNVKQLRNIKMSLALFPLQTATQMHERGLNHVLGIFSQAKNAQALQISVLWSTFSTVYLLVYKAVAHFIFLFHYLFERGKILFNYSYWLKCFKTDIWPRLAF